MIKRTRTKWKPKGMIFAVADQSRQWSEMEKHLALLSDAEKITLSRVTDGRIEGLEFSHKGFSFAIFNSLLWEADKKPEFWFFVMEKEPLEKSLNEVLVHFSDLLK